MQDYSKSNELISLKLGVMTGSTSRKKWLTFCGDAVPQIPDHLSPSLTIAKQEILGNFIAFLMYTITGPFSRHCSEMTDAHKKINALRFDFKEPGRVFHILAM